MARILPPFEPVTQTELRQLWQRYDDHDIRRVLLEVARYRRVLAEIDGLYKNTHKAWRECVGGDLVALHHLFQLMTAERSRLP
jgi:hypothetical protein